MDISKSKSAYGFSGWRKSSLFFLIGCTFLTGVLISVMFNRGIFSSWRRLFSKDPDPPLVLLVSYDGFRWDYLERSKNLVSFQWLLEHGVHATNGLVNSYITVTAPNHYGIVTGLYEESHGIVANRFFDPIMNKSFNYFVDTSSTDAAFFSGIPLWQLNDDAAGSNRRSGCMMWVGCDVPINGKHPTHYMTYNGSADWVARVQKLISWFTDEKDPINFGLLYIEEPDKIGHQVGPDSPKISQMVERLDVLTVYYSLIFFLAGYLLMRLNEEHLLDRMNFIFTSDHGMASVPKMNAIRLDSFLDNSSYKIFGSSPNLNILPNPDKEDEIYNLLKNKVPHLTVYKKNEIPEFYHYNNSDRVMPLVIESDLHWRLITSDEEESTDNSTIGQHGYSNLISDMHPYFIAYGPAFKKNFQVDTFQSIDIYELICYILNMEPAPNNGSFDRVKQLLIDEGKRRQLDTETRLIFKSPANCFVHLFSCDFFNGIFILGIFLTLCLILICFGFLDGYCKRVGGLCYVDKNSYAETIFSFDILKKMFFDEYEKVIFNLDMKNIDRNVKFGLKVKIEYKNEVIVSSVLPDSISYNYFKVGDRILCINNTLIKSEHDIRKFLLQRNDTLQVLLCREPKFLGCENYEDKSKEEEEEKLKNLKSLPVDVQDILRKQWRILVNDAPLQTMEPSTVTGKLQLQPNQVHTYLIVSDVPPKKRLISTPKS
ncbi:type I phosphodiesterase / nucleotide pyrophosphatase [Trichinella nativa]|uniref:Type I phosphodiesterase / nucleotide pyrophosphatase n=2 Tax=Trichinella nativa TaxID=6335 RepID=A0A1Y3EEY8_9BILA|nr:type I phosphodiesterase / nucleotide pyrophosphatase [Trichinella nativa]